MQVDNEDQILEKIKKNNQQSSCLHPLYLYCAINPFSCTFSDDFSV